MEPYDHGTVYGHIALGVENAREICAEIKVIGGDATHDASPIKEGAMIIALVQDPEGFEVEFIQGRLA